MPSPRRRQRRPQLPYRGGNRIKRALHAFNRLAPAAMPIETYTDCRGRIRSRGYGPRANAFAALVALTRRQQQVRSGIVFIGLQGLGHEYHRSRSTAWRSVQLLGAAGLIKCLSGGGKTYDENGQLVARANGYQLHESLLGESPPAAGKGRQPKPELSSQGRDLEEHGREVIERMRARARSGPA